MQSTAPHSPMLSWLPKARDFCGELRAVLDSANPEVVLFSPTVRDAIASVPLTASAAEVDCKIHGRVAVFLAKGARDLQWCNHSTDDPSPGSDHLASRSPRLASDVSVTPVCGCRRPHELREARRRRGRVTSSHRGHASTAAPTRWRPTPR